LDQVKRSCRILDSRVLSADIIVQLHNHETTDSVDPYFSNTITQVWQRALLANTGPSAMFVCGGLTIRIGLPDHRMQ